jgi:Cys-rich protein (TIGR01571 family)
MQPSFLSGIGFLVGICLLAFAGVTLIQGDSLEDLQQKTKGEVIGFAKQSAVGHVGRRLMMLDMFIGEDDSDEKDDEKDGKLIQKIIEIIIELVWTLCGLVFAFFYKSKVVDRIVMLPQMQPGDPPLKEFAVGGQPISLLECCNGKECNIFIHVFCCASCRAGHTMQVAGVWIYWPVVLLMHLLPQLGCGCCIGMYFRSQMRSRFGMAPDLFMDALIWCFCQPCAIAQEAIMVDRMSGVEVACPFALTIKPVTVAVAAAGPGAGEVIGGGAPPIVGGTVVEATPGQPDTKKVEPPGAVPETGDVEKGKTG